MAFQANLSDQDSHFETVQARALSPTAQMEETDMMW